MLAVFLEYLVRFEARMSDDGGYDDEGAGSFGYDFSDGLSGSDPGTATVRPHRESALKRWRRRRSDLRRQRLKARVAAEGRRLDEILDKLHRLGRPALTDEEQRFLVRVSAKLRKRPRDQA